VAAAGVGGYLLGTRSRPADPSAPGGDAQAAREVALARIPADGFFVASLKASKVWDHAGLKPLRDWADGDPRRRELLESWFGFLPGEVDRVSAFWHHPGAARTVSHGELALPYLLVTTRAPYDEAVVVKRLRGQGPTAAGDTFDVASRLFSTAGGSYLTVIDPTSALLAPQPSYQDAAAPLTLAAQLMNRQADGPLAPALDAASRYALVVALDVPRLAPLLKVAKIDTPYAAMLEARTALLTADLDDAIAVRLEMTFADEAAATRARPELEKLLAGWAGSLDAERGRHAAFGEAGGPAATVFGWAAGALRAVKVEVAGNALRANARVPLDDAFRAAVVALPRVLEGHASLLPAADNLKQIGLALHNYHDTTNQFPGDVVPAVIASHPWSWRVQILPYIDHDNEYRLLNFNLPWTDPANRKVLESMPMPKVFAHPGRPAPKGHTYFRVFMRPKNAKGGSGPIFAEGQRGARLTDITDGTSNTILVVEAQDAVPWYAPDLLPYDGELPLPPLGDPKAPRFLALMADGNVRTFARDTDPAVLRALISRNGGEMVELPK
jgi:hypothetical protein